MKDGIKKYKKIDVCKLNVAEKWCDGFLVTFPVSYRYNGGVREGDEVYTGYEVVNPKIPAGFMLKGIGCGLQLNAHPPCDTRYLHPVTPEAKKISKKRSTLKRYLAEQGC